GRRRRAVGVRGGARGARRDRRGLRRAAARRRPRVRRLRVRLDGLARRAPAARARRRGRGRPPRARAHRRRDAPQRRPRASGRAAARRGTRVRDVAPRPDRGGRDAGRGGGWSGDRRAPPPPAAPAPDRPRRVVRHPPPCRGTAPPNPPVAPPRGDLRMTARTDRRAVALATWAVFAVFFLNGFNFATWASRLPAVRDSLGFTEAQMGLLLLFMAVGSLLALPLSGMVVQRLGASKAVTLFAVANVVGLVTAVTGVATGEDLVVRVGLFLAGVGTGVWDAAMNLEGAAVEQRLGKAIMPRFHAGFSFGTMA